MAGVLLRQWAADLGSISFSIATNQRRTGLGAQRVVGFRIPSTFVFVTRRKSRVPGVFKIEQRRYLFRPLWATHPAWSSPLGSTLEASTNLFLCARVHTLQIGPADNR